MGCGLRAEQVGQLVAVVRDDREARPFSFMCARMAS
jgi:hypothetical protein